jgi:polyhydroxybutyrate depolymerase
MTARESRAIAASLRLCVRTACLALLLVMMPATTQSQTTLERIEITQGNSRRIAHLHVPAALKGKQGHAAVFVFHGGEGDGERIAAQTNLARYADRYGFIAVFPTAGSGQWNDGRATTAGLANDTGFVRTLIAHVADKYGVDRNRLFVTGPSNGGMFTQRLACEMADQFRAFASVIANLPVDQHQRCKPSQAVPILLMNGTQDVLMRWNGGEIPSNPARGIGIGGRVISTPETVQFWSNVNGCTGVPQDSIFPDSPDDGTTVVRHLYRRCKPRSEVEFYEIRGGGHNWPGSPLAPRTIRGGRSSRDVNASDVIVSFFRRHGL